MFMQCLVGCQVSYTSVSHRSTYRDLRSHLTAAGAWVAHSIIVHQSDLSSISCFSGKSMAAGDPGISRCQIDNDLQGHATRDQILTSLKKARCLYEYSTLAF